MPSSACKNIAEPGNRGDEVQRHIIVIGFLRNGLPQQWKSGSRVDFLGRGQGTSGGLLVFFNDTATTEIYTLSLHDALPISLYRGHRSGSSMAMRTRLAPRGSRSEEHTSELLSLRHLVCRLLLEKKKTKLAVGMTTRVRGIPQAGEKTTYRL